MATTRLKKTFLLRFLGYFAIFIGAFAILFEFGPVLSSEIAFRKDELLGVRHVLPLNVVTSKSGSPSNPGNQAGFSALTDSNTDVITPVSTDFGIVIEKINANARVIPDVDPSNQAQYMDALSKGVAEAKGSTPPGQAGNLYIFSHSTDGPWDIVRYNAIFYLLRDLVPGDRVVIFYQGRRYDYIVFDTQIVPPSNVSFLTNRYDKPVLTLQTCDPPGTSINRLIVRAQLASS